MDQSYDQEKSFRLLVKRAQAILAPMISEQRTKLYDLSTALSKAEVFSWSKDSLVAVYQKLFLTQAALCEIYYDYEKELDRALVLTSVDVCVRVLDSPGLVGKRASVLSVSELDALTPNFEFFSQAERFYSTNAADVTALMESFWQRYDIYTSLDSSELTQLLPFLNQSSNLRDLKALYRKKAHTLHPDRGGDQEAFIALRREYEVLKSRFL